MEERAMVRRGLLRGVLAGGALLLGGCVPGSLERRVNRAAEEVDGVDSSELSLGRGGTFRPQLSGEVRCGVEGGELEAVFDEAWRQVVTLLHGADDGGRQVQGVTAIGADGTVIGPADWLPEEHGGYIAVSDFFERYGLD